MGVARRVARTCGRLPFRFQQNHLNTDIRQRMRARSAQVGAKRRLLTGAKRQNDNNTAHTRRREAPTSKIGLCSNDRSVVARVWQALGDTLLAVHYNPSTHGTLTVMLVMMGESIIKDEDGPGVIDKTTGERNWFCHACGFELDPPADPPTHRQ